MIDARLVAAAVATLLGTATGLSLPTPHRAPAPTIQPIESAPEGAAQPAESCVCPHSNAAQRLAALHQALGLTPIKAAGRAVTVT